MSTSTTERTADLSPAQRKALDNLLTAKACTNVLELRTRPGLGRTTVLRCFRELTGGALIDLSHVVDAVKARHPLALEEGLFDVVLGALSTEQIAIVDDLHVITRVATACYGYPRAGYLYAPLNAMITYASACGKTLIFGTTDKIPMPLAERALAYGIEAFTPEDYRHLGRVFLGEKLAEGLDFDKIHRFAPRLTAHALRSVGRWFAERGHVETDEFIEYLRSQRLVSNVHLSEVADVDLDSLKGVDDVIRSLETNIILPLENDELSRQLNLSPKRGVLLVGPPGTGKTTVGRALARRLRSKFFLIDGTFVSGTRDFYQRIHGVFQAAQDNAPSIIFIDDSDVLFESGQEFGLYRYLLTMLDGLESESAGRVCVMMTAMNVGNIPPALVRSGRIELWLEMHLPDESARATILEELCRGLPAPFVDIDVTRLAEATEGFTGADLRRLSEDGRALYGYDVAHDVPLRSVTAYFVDAVDVVRRSKAQYAAAEAGARARHPQRPPWFNAVAMTETLAGED